jgi:hypothetical protein
VKPDLSQLRDIHLPAPVSWWPPAPGWWVLLLLALIFAGLVYLFYLRHRRNRWRQIALAELVRLRGETPDRLLPVLSVLLRRVAISRFPRHDVASLTGDAWLAFLDRALGDGAAFQSGAGRILLNGPYADKVDADAESLLVLCERWIKRLPARGTP